LANWWIAYYYKGKLHREATGTSIKGEAERLLRARLTAVDQGTLVEPAAKKTTLADLRRLVETDYRNNRRNSLREVVRCYDRLDEHFGEGCLARSISTERVEGYKAERLAQAAAATINRELAMLRRGFRLALRLGRVSMRPDFSLLREDNVRRGFFELEQFEAVREKLPHSLQPLATFLYWTGWRKSEALGLEWRHVDLKAGVIRIDTSKNGEPRTIPYAVVPALKAVIEGQHEHAVALGRSEGLVVRWVFDRDGERTLDFGGAWSGACVRAGMPGRLVHDFRRTAARNMMRAGIPQNVAMKIGGWKTDSVFRRYAIVDEGLLAENMRKLAALDRS
jgi:integrase